MEKTGDFTDSSKQIALYTGSKSYYLTNKLSNSVLEISISDGSLKNLPDDQFKRDLTADMANIAQQSTAKPAGPVQGVGPAHFDYLIGMLSIQGCRVLLLVCEASPAMSFDNMAVFKIKKVHFQRVSATAGGEPKHQDMYNEEVNRITRLYTKYGYYARGGNLSNTFTDIVKKHYGVPDESPAWPKNQLGLAELILKASLDKKRRHEYSANNYLIRDIETCMREQLWMFDVIFVDFG